MFEYLKDTTGTGLGCMFVVSMGALLFGVDNGWWGTIQGADAFRRDFGHCKTVDGLKTCDLTTSQRALGSSVQSGGIMIGSLLAIYVNRLLGRKRSIVITGLISIVGVIIEMTSAVGGSPRFSQLVIGKTVASVSMGLAANIVPIYLSETSTAAARGFGINVYQNVLIVGFLISIGIVYASAKRDDSASYYIPIGLQLIAPIAMISTSPFLPESPRWLVFKGRYDEAVTSAARLFGTASNGFDANKYVHDLRIVFEAEMANPEAATWRDLFRQPDLRRLLLASGIQCWQQAQGSGYIINYMVSFLRDAGISNSFPYNLGANLVYYAGILTGHLFPDRFGRRPTLLYSMVGNAVFMLAIASTNQAVSPTTSLSGKASVVLLFLWEACNGAMSPLIWIICTEAAPTGNRETVLAIAVFMGFGVSLLITSVSPYLQDQSGAGLGNRIGFIWGAASVCSIVWSYYLVPETKGLSLEQLDYLYEQKVSSRKFSQHVFTDSVLPEEKGGDEKEGGHETTVAEHEDWRSGKA